MGVLHLVGEHSSEEAQGALEGSRETGEWAAAAILADLGRGAVAERGAAWEGRKKSLRREARWNCS